ncbi:GAF domain-containing protein [Bacillus sp. NEB1478]|uniref:helix-turn-helix domain-containing protein n=1 Tax=Bacillus sp. NEB1478 TaxID=3073816 RepID=UPI002872FC34|nr:helix-turn-helix domain-containing protein [Bacillus sp. NEB1478]WNB91730.1 GAF domain-containing protein [Bacillus sp. NEB1478]
MRSEKQLVSLINAARVLTSTLDLDIVLDKLISEVLNVIDGAEAVILFIYDKKREKLVINKCIGFDQEYMQHIELNLDEGMTGKTFTTRKAQIFSHINDTTKGMENIQPGNQENFHRALRTLHHFPKSTICAPLLSKEGCLGVLTIDSFSEDMLFDQQDLLILETFANQASIAIENATLFSQQERSKQIHYELAQASISQQGLEKVSETLAKLINRDVCLFNEFLDFTVASSTDAKQHGINAAKEHSSLFNKIIQGYPIMHEQINRGSIFLFPIKTDKVVIGVIAIFGEMKDNLDSLDEIAIDLANNIFALELMGQERMLSDLYKYEGYLLEQLLNHKLDSFTQPQRNIVGISNKNKYLCVNIQISNQLLPFQELSSKRQLFNRLLYRELQKLEYKVLMLDRNMEYDILVIIHNKKEEDKVIQMLSDFFSTINHMLKEMTSFVFHVGIGRVFNRLNEIGSSNRDAIRCVEFLKMHNSGDVVFSYQELGIYRLFLKHDREELKDYTMDLLGPLIIYDEEHDTDLVKTLNTFLECQQNMTLTAAKSFVHLNTIKYRLQKIKGILKMDKLQGKELFELQLAIYLDKYLKLNN